MVNFRLTIWGKRTTDIALIGSIILEINAGVQILEQWLLQIIEIRDLYHPIVLRMVNFSLIRETIWRFCVIFQGAMTVILYPISCGNAKQI